MRNVKRNRYDALDRIIACATSNSQPTQRFYKNSRLVTEIDAALTQSIVEHGGTILAQQRQQGNVSATALLMVDRQRSTLASITQGVSKSVAYTPYGHHVAGDNVLGFNGERPEPVTGDYLLGIGYRGFNTTLMRFSSADSLSPFGRGGINAYAYCVGDPVNLSDPTGHFPNILKGLLNLLKLRTPKKVPSVVIPAAWADDSTINLKSMVSGTRSRSSGYVHESSLTSANGPYGYSGFSSGTFKSGNASSHSTKSLDSASIVSVQNLYKGSGSFASTSSLELPVAGVPRIPTGKSELDIQQWVNKSSNTPGKDLQEFTQIPKPGAELVPRRLTDAGKTVKPLDYVSPSNRKRYNLLMDVRRYIREGQ